MIVGNGKYQYERVENWLKLPEYWDLGEPAGVACDSHDRVYIFCRGQHPLMIFDREGHFVSSWGEGRFTGPHGIFIGPDDSVYLTDYQSHVVEKYSPGGELLMTLGTRNFAPPVFLRRPFNQPTGVALGKSGEMYISDGYANFVVHKFSSDGKLLKTWGTCGSDPGQFAWPHSIAVDGYGKVYVCDRENDRIQIFTSEGEFVDMWTDFMNPHDLYIDQESDLVYTVESNLRNLSKPGQESRVTVRNLEGGVLSEWHGREGDGSGVFEVPHDIWVDSHGDIYVAELREKNRVLKFALLKE
jgi:DNA-binding beta-propeller fold protein YncE